MVSAILWRSKLKSRVARTQAATRLAPSSGGKVFPPDSETLLSQASLGFQITMSGARPCVVITQNAWRFCRLESWPNPRDDYGAFPSKACSCFAQSAGISRCAYSIVMQQKCSGASGLCVRSRRYLERARGEISPLAHEAEATFSRQPVPSAVTRIRHSDHRRWFCVGS